MRPRIRHEWDVRPDAAREIQNSLVRRVTHCRDETPIHTVAGVDVSFPGVKSRAAVAVMTYPDLQPVDSSQAVMDILFPYVPGLLAFREGPVVLAALARLATKPDILIFDGHGWAHPRRMGIASHIGVLLDVATIGCAKSRLTGKYQEPGPRRGAYEWLYDDDEIIGAVLRTRDKVSPLFVSVGHRMNLAGAMDVVLRCCTGFRLPEPIRQAHRLADAKVAS